MEIEEIIKRRRSQNSADIKEMLDTWEEKSKEEYCKLLDELSSIGSQDNELPRDINLVLDMVNCDIKDVNEKAYQRAFFQRESTKLVTKDGERKITWIDVEVPVELKNQPRRMSLDLVGLDGHQKDIVIVELKSCEGESPFYAAYEVLRYALLIKNVIDRGILLPFHSYDGLEEKSENYWKDYHADGSLLIVGAPNMYWRKWDQCFSKLNEITVYVAKRYSYNLIFVKYPDVDFKKQKGTEETYCPNIDHNSKENIWTEILV